MTRTVMVALLLMLGLAAPASAADPLPSEDFRGFVDQARFQIRKGFWDQAALDLERAVAHPDGKVDPEAWFLLAQVRMQLADLPGARIAAENALTFARDPEQEAATAALVDVLATTYGLVRIEAFQPGTPWRPKLELDGTLFDGEQVAYVDRLEKRLRRQRPVLPLTVGLPIGDWTINGQTAQVRPDAPTRVVLGTRAAGGGMAAARLAWLEVGAGIAAWLSGERHLLPAPDTQVALTLPIGGPWAVGLVAHWTPEAYQTTGGDYRFATGSTTAGLRFGPLLDDGERFLIRPAIGWRAGRVGGFELPCTQDDGAISCGPGPADLVLYANGVAQVVFAEVAADYLDRSRTSGVGAGVRLVMEHAFVTIPRSGTSQGLEVDYTVDDAYRHPGRTGLRVLANVSVAF